MLTSYKELIVWQKAIELVKEVYKATQGFPKEELYVLTVQMRRCAISIPSNIAEGYKRKGRREYLQFLRIASGSASELETQIIVSKSIYSKLDFSTANALLIEVQKMLEKMLKTLSSRLLNPEPYTLYPQP